MDRGFGIYKTFLNEQLADIVKNPNATWCFRSIRRDPTRYIVLREYIDDITRAYLNEDKILKNGITSSFIEKWLVNDIKWLHQF